MYTTGEAAARINAMLAQKGIPLHEDGEAGADQAGEFVKDIPINDLKNRYMLTRGATQTQIQQETGAGRVFIAFSQETCTDKHYSRCYYAWKVLS